MESNHEFPVPTNSNSERVSIIQRASTPEEVFNKESYGTNNKPVISYHRRYPDGAYVPVMLSPSFRFCPEDDELIVDYLNKEINKEEAPYNRIPKVNIYNHTPEELAELYQSLRKDEWHFYSPRERKYFNGSRPNRAAVNGFWKTTGADKKIYSDGKCVGSKRCLVFYQGTPKQGSKTNWIMHEYVADQPQRRRLPNDADDMRLDDCVLCQIYKRSEHSSKEEKEAATSQPGETAAKPAAPKSSENKKKANPKRRKTEHEGTNQQHNLPVLQPNLQTPQPNVSTSQWNQHAANYRFWQRSYNLGGLLDFYPQRNPEDAQPIMLQPNLSMPQQNLPTPQQNQQVMQYSPQPRSNYLGGQLRFRPESIPEEAKPIMLHPNIPTSQQNPQTIMKYNRQPWSYNLGGQLDFPMERNPEDAQPIMLQPNLSTPQQNLPTPQQNQQVMQYSPQPRSNYLGGQLDFPMERNPEEAQPIMPEPNLPTTHQNLQVTQYILEAGSQNLGGLFDFPMESIPEEVNQFYFDDLGNGHETVGNSISMDTLGNPTYPPLFQNGFKYNDDFYPLSSLDSFDPIPPSLYNNDHPQSSEWLFDTGR